MNRTSVTENRQFAFQFLCAYLGALTGFLVALTSIYPAHIVLATEIEFFFWAKVVMLCSFGGPGMLIVFGPLLILREVKCFTRYKNTYALGGMSLFAITAALTFFINPLP